MKMHVPPEVYSLLECYQAQGATKDQLKFELDKLTTDFGYLTQELDTYGIVPEWSH